MKIDESGNYLFVTIESTDWQYYGRNLLDDIKAIPGRIYYPHNKSWKILKSQLKFLTRYLPLFTAKEELEGELALTEFMNQFEESDNAYSL